MNIHRKAARQAFSREAAVQFENAKRDNLVNGLKVPHFVIQDRIDALAWCIEPRPTDVWLVTYPRSGTTLTQGLLTNLLNKDPLAYRYQVVPWPEVGKPEVRYYSTLEEINALPGPRCFKSHWPATDHVDPARSNGKFIHISRNCLDMVTSYYYQYRNPIDGDRSYNDSIHAFVEQFLSGDLRWGDYFEHLRSWFVHRGRQNILFLTYEGIVLNMPETVRQLSAFIGIPVNSADVKRIVGNCQFHAMKQREPHMKDHYRRGMIGGHAQLLDDRQRQLLLSRLDDMMRTLDLPGN